MRRFPQLEILALVAGIAITLAPPSLAAWNPAGEPIPVPAAFASPCFCPDGDGGAFSFWTEYVAAGSAGTTVRLWGHRRAADGADLAGWPGAGRLLGEFPVGYFATFPFTLAAPDGGGGAFVLAFDPHASPGLHLRRLFRVLPGGALAPGWPDAGLAVGDSALSSVFQLLADGAGGAYVGWTDVLDPELVAPSQQTRGLFEARAARVLADGTFAPGWSAAGNLIEGVAPDRLRSMLARSLWLAADPVGGLFAANVDSSDGNRDAHLWHFGATGALAAGWPASGVPVATSTQTQLLSIASDGVGGVHAAFEDSLPYPQGGAPRVVHLDGAGQTEPGWPPGGLDPFASEFPYRAAGGAAGDGAGGVFLMCGSFNDLGQAELNIVRRDGNAAMHAGWPASGVVVSDSLFPRILQAPVPDGAGGVYAVWQSDPGLTGLSREIVALRLRGDGAAAPGWALAAPRRVSMPAHTALVDVQGDGRGACYALAQDQFLYTSWWLYQISSDDPASTSAAASTIASALELSARPNPTPGDVDLRFVLPSAANTTLGIYEVGGRLVKGWTGGMAAGAQRFSWDGRTAAGERAAPGLYFAVVRAGSMAGIRRIAVVR